jgi:hypothetical protein
MLGLIFGLFKSQHAADVRAQHDRRARKKDTKAVKEIHTHLNLQPPRSPIASEGEESPEIESIEERVSQYEVENPCTQWYGDMSFDGFSYGVDSSADPSYTQPPPFASPPTVMKVTKKVDKRVMMMSKAF